MNDAPFNFRDSARRLFRGRLLLFLLSPLLSLLLALPWLVAEGCGGRAARRPRGVVLITIDTLRADRLGCTGRAQAKTPVLDDLAGKGVLCDRVIVSAPITLPSHIALMTGRLPHETGVRDNRPFALSKDAVTLAEILSRAGFQTMAVVSGEPLAPGCGLEQGFDKYLFHPAPRRAGVLLRESPADRTAALALKTAAGSDRGKPFFLWVHFFDPHFPYTAPIRVPGGDSYDGEVAFTDRGIGRLLDGLDSLGLMKDTLLVVTADHGEGLLEHGEPTHAYFLYDSTLRVPLIVAGPGITRGGRIEKQVPAIDIPGAILTLLGLSGARDPEAAKILATAFETGKLAEPSRPVFSESLFCSNHFHWAQLTALRTDSFKVVRGARIQAFDLDTDPGELSPVPIERAGPKARRLARLLEERLKNARAAMPPGPRLFGSLPGYFGSARTGKKAFLDDESNSRRPHPPDRTDFLNRFLKAVALSQENLYNRAGTMLEELVKEDPANPTCVFWLGRTTWSQGLKEGSASLLGKAYGFFEKALELDPGFRDAGHMATWCLIELGRFEEAKRSLDSSRRREQNDPKDLELYGYLFTTTESNGRKNPYLDIPAGVNFFEKSLSADQNNPRLLQKLIALYKSLGRKDRARELEGVVGSSDGY